METSKKPLSISINKTEDKGATNAKVENGVKTAEVINPESTPKTEVPKPAEQVKPAIPAMPSIEELQAKAEKTAKLVQRYQTIKLKKAEIDSFVILHESDRAQLEIEDCNGRRIVTQNLKSIEQVLVIWKNDINEALTKAEQEIREIMNAQQATPEILQIAA